MNDNKKNKTFSDLFSNIENKPEEITFNNINIKRTKDVKSTDLFDKVTKQKEDNNSFNELLQESSNKDNKKENTKSSFNNLFEESKEIHENEKETDKNDIIINHREEESKSNNKSKIKEEEISSNDIFNEIVNEQPIDTSSSNEKIEENIFLQETKKNTDNNEEKENVIEETPKEDNIEENIFLQETKDNTDNNEEKENIIEETPKEDSIEENIFLQETKENTNNNEEKENVIEETPKEDSIEENIFLQETKENTDNNEEKENVNVIEETPKDKNVEDEKIENILDENPFFIDDEKKEEVNPFYDNNINLVENNDHKNITEEKSKIDTTNVKHFNVKIVKKKDPPLKFIIGVLSYALFIWLLLVGIVLLVYVADIKIKAARGDNSVPTYNAYMVLTGSMLPEIKVYDVVITKKTEPKDLKENDIITFASSDTRFAGTTITHRIIKKYYDAEKKEYTFQTKGDNNNVADSALVQSNNIYGKVILKIPKLGYLQEFLAKDGGWIIAILLPCVAVIAYDIVKLTQGLKRKKYKNIKSTK